MRREGAASPVVAALYERRSGVIERTTRDSTVIDCCYSSHALGDQVFQQPAIGGRRRNADNGCARWPGSTCSSVIVPPRLRKLTEDTRVHKILPLTINGG
ncbi:MAG: hypothetical protein U0V70_12080 [Terriglobia bacterium]